jgi:putative methyltransferase (TIGR04325 family)
MKAELAKLWHWMPPGWRRSMRRLVSRPVYEGDYSTWNDARRMSRGYAHPHVMEKVVSAARAVRDNRASWERDSVLFYEPSANESLLRGLNHVATANHGRLDVLDFGGALGSTWWQHRPWLTHVAQIRWSIVEQPALVDTGRREFTLGPLRFFESLEECWVNEHPDAILLSSVLPYIENPHGLLREVCRYGFRYIIIDRTGFVNRGRDRLTVQHVPPSIYDASYPCWFFDRTALLASLGSEWHIVSEWITNDHADIDAEHRGLLLERTVP